MVINHVSVRPGMIFQVDGWCETEEEAGSSARFLFRVHPTFPQDGHRTDRLSALQMAENQWVSLGCPFTLISGDITLLTTGDGAHLPPNSTASLHCHDTKTGGPSKFTPPSYHPRLRRHVAETDDEIDTPLKLNILNLKIGSTPHPVTVANEGL